MANITKVTGRHVWKETILTAGSERIPGIICINCRAYRYGRDSDRPVVGCLSDVDLSRAGDSRLGDYRNQEMARRGALDRAEREEFQHLLQESR